MSSVFGGFGGFCPVPSTKVILAFSLRLRTTLENDSTVQPKAHNHWRRINKTHFYELHDVYFFMNFCQCLPNGLSLDLIIQTEKSFAVATCKSNQKSFNNQTLTRPLWIEHPVHVDVVGLLVAVEVVPERKNISAAKWNLSEIPPIADKILLAENGSVWTEKPSLSSLGLAHVEHLMTNVEHLMTTEEGEMKTNQPDIWPFDPCKYQVNMADLKKRRYCCII